MEKIVEQGILYDFYEIRAIFYQAHFTNHISHAMVDTQQNTAGFVAAPGLCTVAAEQDNGV